MKFTFSNWLNDEIPDSLLNVDTGLLPHFFIDHMTKPDWQLLYDYQRSAYQLLVEYIAAITTDSFRSDISGAPDVQAAVTHKINKLEKQFNSLSDEDQELILQGDFNAVGLTSKICKKIQEIARAYPIDEFRGAYKRGNYLEHLFKDGDDQDVTWFFAKCRNLNTTISGAIDHKTMLHLKQPESKPINKTGRPLEFNWEDTRNWHDELKEKKDYQHANGTPYLTKIREKIQERHGEKTGFAPSLSLIKLHYRENNIS